jgi:stage II sporulation protein E
MLVSTLISLLLGLKVDNFTAIIATITGTIFFVFSPQSLINRILPYFSEAEVSSSSKIVSSRLKSASSSLSVLADALEALYPKKTHEKEILNGDIYQNAVNKVCKKCPSMGVCWGNKYNDTTDTLNKMVNSLKYTGEFQIPLHFKSICSKNALISEEIKSSFLLSKENRKNEGKLDLVKNAVSESYRSLSFLLDDLSAEVETICYPDSEGEILLKNALLEENAQILSLSAFILNGGKTIYDFILKSPLNDSSLERIKNGLSDIRGDKYSLPILISAGENYLYQFSEIENYSFEFDDAYLNIKCDGVSGDKLCSFSTKYGFYYTILSDGMGSGKKAAREAEITAVSLKELISGGLTLKSAIKIVNSMLVSQTDNEISSAIDIVKIDKYTAEASIFKAGGTPTLIRQKGKVSLIESPSMPIGILADEEIFETKINLSDGDIIITLSDGVLENGVDWLKGILSQKRLKTPKEIKESILDYIEKNDITFSDDAALGIMLIEKN